MTVITDKTVRELALETPTATRVFEGWESTIAAAATSHLVEACRTANLNVDQVLDSLEVAEESARAATDRAQLADRAARGSDRPHQEHSSQVHARRDRPLQSTFGQGLLRSRQESSGTAPDPRQLFEGLAQELTSAPDERREWSCFRTS